MKLPLLVSTALYVAVNAGSFEISRNYPSSEEELPMPELDKRLAEEIKNPTPNNGDRLYQQTFQFYNRLYHIFEVVNNDVSIEKDALETGRRMYETGGPTFFNSQLDYERMKGEYKWEDIDYEEYKETVDKIKALWHMVVLCYKNKSWRTETEPPNLTKPY